MTIIRTREGKIHDFTNLVQSGNLNTLQGSLGPIPTGGAEIIPDYDLAQGGLTGTHVVSAKEALVLSQLAYFDFSNYIKELGLNNENNNRTLKEIAKLLYVTPEQQSNNTALNDFLEFGDLTNAEKNDILGKILKDEYPGISNLVVSSIYKNSSCDYDAISFFDKNDPNSLIIANTGSQGSQVGE